ncbi:hypothetical protein BLOT_003962 [Blomia tropicalis]|nr:hypothetical protein BLOT_003962 [Blomia tropicalis]
MTEIEFNTCMNPASEDTINKIVDVLELDNILPIDILKVINIIINAHLCAINIISLELSLQEKNVFNH